MAGFTTVTEEEVEVENHFKWLNELLPSIPKHSLTVSGGSTDEYIRSLVENIRLQEEESSPSCRVTDLCWKLNLAAQYIFIQDFESALRCIKMAKDELELHVNGGSTGGVDKPSPSHISAYKYAIQATSLIVVNQLMKKHGLSNVDVGIDLGQFDLRWKELCKDDKVKAVVSFMKACLASSMRLPDAIVLDKLKQAVSLEPDFHGWYRYLYRKLRQIRRNAGDRPNMIPTDEEKGACKMAYSLRPDLGDNISNMANMFEEVLNSSKRTMPKNEIDEQVNMLINLLKDSMKVSSDDPWAKIRLAEIYAYGNYQLNPKTGEKLFNECVEKWPSSSMAWHKAGKFYHLGGNPRGGGRFMNFSKATECYKRALQASSYNFPCLMDYLKLLQESREGDEVDKLIDVIDEYLPNAKKEAEFRKLLTIKGLLLWIHNVSVDERLRACRCLAEILDKFPNSALEISNCIKRKRMEIVGLMDINIDEMIPLLEKLNVSSSFKLISALRNEKQGGGITSTTAQVKTNEKGDKAGNVKQKVVQISNVSKNEAVPDVVRTPAPVYPSRGRGRGQTTRMSSVSTSASEPAIDA